LATQSGARGPAEPGRARRAGSNGCVRRMMALGSSVSGSRRPCNPSGSG
jgi:hypothetical protein